MRFEGRLSLRLLSLLQAGFCHVNLYPGRNTKGLDELARLVVHSLPLLFFLHFTEYRHRASI